MRRNEVISKIRESTPIISDEILEKAVRTTISSVSRSDLDGQIQPKDNNFSPLTINKTGEVVTGGTSETRTLHTIRLKPLFSAVLAVSGSTVTTLEEPSIAVVLGLLSAIVSLSGMKGAHVTADEAAYALATHSLGGSEISEIDIFASLRESQHQLDSDSQDYLVGLGDKLSRLKVVSIVDGKVSLLERVIVAS
jgi:hypothetical protein